MILQSIKMAWEAVCSNKMRSFLTMLGIIIGVTALVVLVSLVDGATGSITSEVQALGNDMLTVSIADDKGAPLRPSVSTFYGTLGFVFSGKKITNCYKSQSWKGSTLELFIGG